MAIANACTGYIQEHYIICGLKFLPVDEDLNSYDLKLEHFEYIDVDHITVYGEDREIRYQKAFSDELMLDGYDGIPRSRIFKLIKCCLVLTEDMPFYQELKDRCVVKLDFYRFIFWKIDNWVDDENYILRYFFNFISKINKQKVFKIDRNFKFISQEQLDRIDEKELRNYFSNIKYDTLNDDVMYDYFERYVRENGI